MPDANSFILTVPGVSESAAVLLVLPGAGPLMLRPARLE